jgi:hypothetical protein
MLSSLQRAAAATTLGDAPPPPAEEDAVTAAAASSLQSYPLDCAPLATPPATHADAGLAGADAVTPHLEREYVHAMYDAIAPHFR